MAEDTGLIMELLLEKRDLLCATGEHEQRELQFVGLLS